MSGIALKLTIKGDAKEKLAELIGKLDNQQQFFAAASEIMLDQTQARFKEQRGPDGTAWKPLAPATVASRGSSSPILEVSGALRNVHAAPTSDTAKVETSPLVYAAIQNEGGKAGRGNSVTIPARPYFGFGDDDINELEELAESMLFVK